MAAALCSGYASIGTTGTEAQLSSTATVMVKWLRIKAPLGNKYTIVLGPTGVTDDKAAATAGYLLVPGDKETLGEVIPDDVFINGKAGDEVYFVGGTGS